MALLINTLGSPYSQQRVSVSGLALTTVLKYNSRNSSWYLDILDSAGEDIILAGIKIMPNQNLTGRYILDSLPNGNFWCFRQKADYSDVSRDNFGADEVYGLYWVPATEEEELGINGVIQL